MHCLVCRDVEKIKQHNLENSKLVFVFLFNMGQEVVKWTEEHSCIRPAQSITVKHTYYYLTLIRQNSSKCNATNYMKCLYSDDIKEQEPPQILLSSSIKPQELRIEC